MRKLGGLGLILFLVLLPQRTSAGGWRKDNTELLQLNRHLAGRLVDHTFNHGHDNRIWSPALGQRRDLYVYLPPDFDPGQRYPVLIYLHGFGQDEQSFLRHIVLHLDRAIISGRLPPLIVAAPDGSINGEPCRCVGGSFFLNAKPGRFEDFVIEDVWGFLVHTYPIRPERQAHVLAGISMGGFGAYNLGMKHRDTFAVVAGICPPLNLRWVGKDGNYQANFDPNNWGWRTEIGRGREVLARFLGGTVKIRLRDLLRPVFGLDPMAIEQISRENPIEMLDRFDLREGELAMFVAYNGKDQYNIDAQVESFLYMAHARGLRVDVVYDPAGRHLMPEMTKHLPALFDWLAPRLAPYSPIRANLSVPVLLPPQPHLPTKGE
jgi:enterochelin esterase-like enzyme